jgi:hypothetical protein
MIDALALSMGLVLGAAIFASALVVAAYVGNRR